MFCSKGDVLLINWLAKQLPIHHDRLEAALHCASFLLLQSDNFFIKCRDLGVLQRLRIGHNNKGLAADWHLARVEVSSSTSSSPAVVFPCNKWLSAQSGLSLELQPDTDGDGMGDAANGTRQLVDYVVTVHTSDVR